MIFTKLYIRIFKIIVNILSTNKKIQYIEQNMAAGIF
jgi:hypothetical protein